MMNMKMDPFKSILNLLSPRFKQSKRNNRTQQLVDERMRYEKIKQILEEFPVSNHPKLMRGLEEKQYFYNLRHRPMTHLDWLKLIYELNNWSIAH